ncbi:hypothetical protein M0804_001669 [Polistes exclamans]|nr:hypothetical protein M0804_001669 [Polistes exclamans]
MERAKAGEVEEWHETPIWSLASWLISSRYHESEVHTRAGGRSRHRGGSGHSMIHSAGVGPQSSLFNDFYSLFRLFNDHPLVARSPCTASNSNGNGSNSSSRSS